jgi:hypothetical protein
LSEAVAPRRVAFRSAAQAGSGITVTFGISSRYREHCRKTPQPNVKMPVARNADS